MERRHFLGTLMGGVIAGLSDPILARASKHSASASDARRMKALPDQIEARLAQIEREVDGRLGVAIYDSASGLTAGHRMHELFPMCSTFKFLAAAAVLARVDRREEDLARRIMYARSDVVIASPATEKHTDTGMTMGELCEAAITLSDDTAGNLLLASFGGPAQLTAFVRQLGDTVTRLDRNEPTVNEAIPGDPRDTTTPIAMLADMRNVLLGDVLTAQSRAQMIAWLVGCQTGGAKLRAKLPKDWRVGDKTGGGEHGTHNDIAIMWPPERAPIFVAAYLTQTDAPFARCDAALADVGEAVASSLG
ncbi:class A beta-lactamase [Trinickia fusca]|uniref:Beta-lactamase n=1 Tax=Trinickia fusca TaxID=2419777 RepID=A0A494X6L9_9BURK|nr:class A beta-lactamase [Trinickia fusca]RKP43844.1 class A beta-lactamase [Trinickia fusca]